jgi:tetratricopeptide (TPR) repeat protein
MTEQQKATSDVEQLLKEGILAKEKRDFQEATLLFTKATTQAEAIGYDHGVLHGLLNLGTIWKLKARETGSKSFATLAQVSFQEAVTYAQEKKMPEEEIMQATFLLGQAAFALDDYSTAYSLYETVFQYYYAKPKSTAHLGDIERHLGESLVKLGKAKEGIDAMQRGLTNIRSFDENDAFDKRNYVWETGALLALANTYAPTDKEKARQLAQEALQIAEREQLTIRIEEAKSKQ